MTSPAGPGFLGSTSFSAVFNEDRDINGLHSHFREDPSDNDLSDGQEWREGRLEVGARVLAALRDTQVFEALIRQWQIDVYGSTILDLWIMACVESIRTELTEKLARCPEGKQELLRLALSEKLFRNSNKPLKVTGTTTINQFATYWNGPHLRWETVGIYFLAVGLGAMKRLSGPSLPADRLGYKSWNALARRMIDLGQTCLTFCEEMGHLTDPMLWLGFEIAILTSVVEGDASGWCLFPLCLS